MERAEADIVGAVPFEGDEIPDDLFDPYGIEYPVNCSAVNHIQNPSSCRSSAL